jgi:hypothetical protein
MDGSVSFIDGHIDDDTPSMTDSEIEKALECCNDNYSCPTDCPLYEDSRDCLLVLNKPILNLINRYKAEVERLREDIVWYRETGFKPMINVKEMVENTE